MTPEELLKRLAVLLLQEVRTEDYIRRYENPVNFSRWTRYSVELRTYLPAQVSPDAPRQLELGEEIE